MANLRYISLGAGKQSTSLGIICGLVKTGKYVPWVLAREHLAHFASVDCAIFADTGDELRATYEHLDRFEGWMRDHGIPVWRVGLGITLAAAAALTGRRRENGNRFFVSLPIYVKGAWQCGACQKITNTRPCTGTKQLDGTVEPCTAPETPLAWNADHVSVARRQCTNEFKLEPIRKKVRDLLGLEPRERANGKLAQALIGISLDEAKDRMRDSRDSYIENTYPLVEARLAVETCVRICKETLGYEPVKSACKYCPYHDDATWARIKRDSPDEFEEACVFDELVRDLSKAGLDGAGYLHRSCIPLREVDFDKEQKGQLFFAGFKAECEGMCGL